MPRATRAAVKAQEEEAITAALEDLPPTPAKGRVPLGEISNNVNTSTMIEGTDTVDEAEKVPAPKSKKGKGGKKSKKVTKVKSKEQEVEILEDENQSSQSDAAEQACADLMNNDAPNATIPDSSESPPSPAAEAASEQVYPGHTPEFDIDVPGEPYVNQIESEAREIPQQDSASGGRSDSSVQQELKNAMTPEKEDDSFVGQIKTRTPAKRISRIEDSVEALDALEDEIEKVDEAIPAAASDRSSPLQVKKRAGTSKNHKDKLAGMPTDGLVASSKASKGKASAADTKAGDVKAKEQPNTGAAKKSVRTRPSNVQPAPASAHKPSQVTSNASGRLSKRVSSIHKVPFQPVKSTKPPTKSNFELPGEAVARKLKEQREERQKRDEEEQSRTTQPKPKPLRRSQAPEIKLNTAAKARLSLVKNAAIENAKPTSASGPRVVASATLSKRLSSINSSQKFASQRTRKVSPAPANTSARRGPSLDANTASRKVNISSPPRPPPTSADIANQKLKGREAYQRARGMLSEKEKEKKAKEEAAKKARIDAAERGRIASREWAEKQKAKKPAPHSAKVRS
ncbi:uncharacterized protein KY384_007005 [Bacidia gigantensis]|uniref:uncharacterized protein n=1 Tax=Bacidia gigantensis TaxID=2732470 RepID=UPI001D03A246|nr:uncharacterized protein KY384_007005 [Bacidia gigantensis]KAG8528089.1 hypothetical protein KY384_007005 [Bacidia gigantensis]